MVVATIQPVTVGVAVVVASMRLVADKMYLPLAWAYHTFVDPRKDSFQHSSLEIVNYCTSRAGLQRTGPQCNWEHNQLMSPCWAGELGLAEQLVYLVEPAIVNVLLKLAVVEGSKQVVELWEQPHPQGLHSVELPQLLLLQLVVVASWSHAEELPLVVGWG